MDFVNFPLLGAAGLVFASVLAGLFSVRIGFSFLLVFLLAGILARQADELRELLQQAQAVSAERNEWDTQIRCLREAVPYWDASQAERQLLDAQSANEYTSALVLYHTQRINRLRKVLSAQA